MSEMQVEIEPITDEQRHAIAQRLSAATMVALCGMLRLNPEKMFAAIDDPTKAEQSKFMGDQIAECLLLAAKMAADRHKCHDTMRAFIRNNHMAVDG